MSTVLSALLFPRGHLSWIRDLWTAGRLLPLICSATARELIAALAYPKFKLGEGEIQSLLAAYLPFTEAIDVSDDTVVDVPRCSDPDDQKFLRLAAVGRADVLVTGDRALLKLAERVPFNIESASEFHNRFG
jgi:putative PIN family toxin of toxin-antitoxin system